MIISLLEKFGRDPKVLDILCNLCKGSGVAVRYDIQTGFHWYIFYSTNYSIVKVNFYQEKQICLIHTSQTN